MPKQERVQTPEEARAEAFRDAAILLRVAAAVARTSKYGEHPQIGSRTHAAALNWAAEQFETAPAGTLSDPGASS